jgi:hypothetical protein
MRANSEPLAPPQVAQVVQIISQLCRTIIPEVFAPDFSLKLPVEAKTARNSLCWTILQGTSLL